VVLLVAAIGVSTVFAQKASGAGTFTDARDGKTYKTVKIGNQKWMAQNLNYKTGNSWCYDGDDSKCNQYGRLYDWNTAKSACPSGWHLPSQAEWKELEAVASGSDAGKKLKAASGWNNNGNGTDEYGFSALPGGNRITDGLFLNAGLSGNWWTATASGSGGAYYRYMGYRNGYVVEDYSDVGSGFSVRCVGD
jgi:uncharacterized protein (TIGR02145 family)